MVRTYTILTITYTDAQPSQGPKNKLYPNTDGVEGFLGAEVADGEIECR